MHVATLDGLLGWPGEGRLQEGPVAHAAGQCDRRKHPDAFAFVRSTPRLEQRARPFDHAAAGTLFVVFRRPFASFCAEALGFQRKCSGHQRAAGTDGCDSIDPLSAGEHKAMAEISRVIAGGHPDGSQGFVVAPLSVGIEQSRWVQAPDLGGSGCQKREQTQKEKRRAGRRPHGRRLRRKHGAQKLTFFESTLRELSVPSVYGVDATDEVAA